MKPNSYINVIISGTCKTDLLHFIFLFLCYKYHHHVYTTTTTTYNHHMCQWLEGEHHWRKSQKYNSTTALNNVMCTLTVSMKSLRPILCLATPIIPSYEHHRQRHLSFMHHFCCLPYWPYQTTSLLRCLKSHSTVSIYLTRTILTTLDSSGTDYLLQCKQGTYRIATDSKV